MFQPADLVASGQAERLTEARKSSGRDPGELAHLLGISYEAYRDLESFDEEIVDTISFRQLVLLAGAVHLDLRSFFGAGDQMEACAFADLAGRLNQLVADGVRDGDPAGPGREAPNEGRHRPESLAD